MRVPADSFRLHHSLMVIDIWRSLQNLSSSPAKLIQERTSWISILLYDA